MAVNSISRNAVEMTADGDVWDEIIRTDSVLAVTTDSGGDVILYTNTVKLTDVHGRLIHDETNIKEYWRSGAMNANATVESVISLGDAYGLKVSMPPNARVVVYHN